MKFIFFFIFACYTYSLFANEDENTQVEVINLYETKSLDQMVLDNLSDEDNISEAVENIDEKENSQVEIKQIEIKKNNFFLESDISEIRKYLNKLKVINSKILENHIISVLENLQFNLENNQDKEIFLLIVDYFKSIGHINKSYELIQRYEFSNDKDYNYFANINLNYLLSTFQLNEACSFKDEINKNINLDFFLLEKLDIFCLILNNNKSEAELLNSILLETEIEQDNYYQLLFSLISDPSDQSKLIKENNVIDINQELIFLYSAMIRIAELPFNHKFYELDKKNLAIPIILNQASPIDLRIKAANESFLNKVINIDSLAALYMSVDFNTDELNNPDNTIETFSNNKELSMAFLFQLVNTQIFPNDRLNALIQFWNFAKKNSIEEIAFKLSDNMLNSIEVSSENITYGPDIALAYIYNNDFDSAENWIELYENAKQIDSKSLYIRVLLDLYSSNDLDSFIKSINFTLNNFSDYRNDENEELLFVLKEIINLDISTNTTLKLDKIFDERLMPSIYLIDEIKNSIEIDNDEKFLIYSLISLSDQEWYSIHPEHLKIILKGYLNYKDGELFKGLILEIFKNYKLII